MPATVEGIVKITNRASGPLREIRNDTTQATKAQDMLGKQTDRTATKVRVNSEQMNRAIKKASDQGVSNIDRLKRSLEVLDKIKANPHIDVDTAAAEAKIRVLKRELNSLETKRARSELSALGVVADNVAAKVAGTGGGGGGGGAVSAAVGAGGGGGRAVGGVAGAFQMAGGRALFMTTAMAAALPAVVALGGALGALAGSAGAAAGGAGALGVGGIGALVVGIGSIVAVAKPAVARLGEAKKAQDNYNKSVEQYGDKSAQAVKAHEAMLTAFKKQPGAAGVLQNKQALGKSWNAQTRPGQDDFIGGMLDGLTTLNKLLPTFATISNRSVASARGAWQGLLGVLSNRESRETYRVLGQMFSEDIGPFSRGLGNVAVFFERVARASKPAVKEMFESFERLTGRMAGAASNSAKTQGAVGGMVDQLKSWIGLFGAATKLAVTFFGAGQRQGKSMVENLTDQLNRWTDWLKDNPSKVQAFFDRAVSATEALAGALATIATTLFQISDALVPVLAGFSSFTSMLGPNVLGALGIAAGARFVGGKVGRATGTKGGGMGGLFGRGGTAAGSSAGGAAAAGASVAAAGAAKRIGAGALLKGAGSIALRKAGPLALAFGAYDFLSAGGSVGNRAGAAANGALLGVPNLLGMNLGKGQQNSAQAQVDKYLKDPRHQNVGSIQAQMDRLRGERDKTKSYTDVASGRTYTPYVHDRGEMRGYQKQIDQLKGALGTAVTARGQTQAAGIGDAYQVRSAKSEKLARTGLFSGLNRELKDLGPQGKAALLKATADWGSALESGTDKQKRTAERLRKYIEKQYLMMGQNIHVVNGQILTGSQTEWKGIADALGSEVERAQQDVTKGFTAIQQQAVGALQSMGFSKSEAKNLVKGSASTRNTAASLAHGNSGEVAAAHVVANPQYPKSKRARGGRLNGVGSADYLNLAGGALGAPGELVVNRHTERKVDQRLGMNGALAMLVGGEHTPHNMGVSPMAKGGRLGGLGQGIAMAAQDVLAKFPGLSVTSTTGGGHAKGSYHYKGQAVDLGGPAHTMNAASAWIASAMGGNLAEGIHNPNMSIKNGKRVDPSFWGAATWAGHQNHIHLAIAGALGALTGTSGGALGTLGAAPKLKGAKASGAGVPGALAQGALDAILGGAQSLIGGEGGGNGGTGKYSGGGGLNGWLSQALKITGHYSKSNLAGLNRMAMGESGGDPNAVQKIVDVNSGNGGKNLARGLLQTIPATFNRYRMPGHDNIFNPVDNAIASIRYQFDRYGKIVGHPGYALGGRLPGIMEMGDGGQFTTTGVPQMMRVGERGQREKVTVQRESAGSGFGGGRSVVIKIGSIQYRNEGDIEKKIKRELAKVARELSDGPIDGEGEL